MMKREIIGKILSISVLIGCVVFAYAEGIDQNVETYKKEIQENNKNLENLKTRIREKSIHSEKLKGKERNIHHELKQITAELNQIQKKISQLNKKIRLTQDEIKEVQQQLLEKKNAAENTRQRLKKYFILLYKYQRNTVEYLPAVMTNAAYEEIVQEETYLRAFSKMNVHLYQQIKIQEEDIRIVKKDLEAKENKLEQLQQEVRGQEEVALKQKKAKNELLLQVKEQRQSTEEEIAQLRKESQELQGLIDSFRSKITALEKEKRKKTVSIHAGKKGSFEWPVQGTVLQQFGKHKHATLDTYIINNGIEIQAPTGTPVKNIEQGTVLYAQAFKSYGQMVIVDHGDDFYTVYAHLQQVSVKEGEPVVKGGVVGLIGNGKNGRSDKPNLYFEIRQNGKPEDPLLWLK